jgi:hypothetical protein
MTPVRDFIIQRSRLHHHTAVYQPDALPATLGEDLAGYHPKRGDYDVVRLSRWRALVSWADYVDRSTTTKPSFP